VCYNVESGTFFVVTYNTNAHNDDEDPEPHLFPDPNIPDSIPMSVGRLTFPDIDSIFPSVKRAILSVESKGDVDWMYPAWEVVELKEDE
jgi:hypothetical protein